MSDMVRIQIGDQAVKDRLNRLFSRLKDRRPLMRKIAADMHDAVKQNFDEHGRPKWKGLSKATRARYAKKGYSLEPTLNRTSGGLFHSINPSSDNDRAVVGTNKRYAAIHQLGGPIEMPARDRILNFRQTNRGKITLGKPGTGDLFAKKNKAHYSMKVPGKAYTIMMPARPYLSLRDQDVEKIVQTVEEYVGEP